MRTYFRGVFADYKRKTTQLLLHGKQIYQKEGKKSTEFYSDR